MKEHQVKYRVNPQFDEETYLRIQRYATEQGRSMSDVVREFTIKGMDRELLGDSEKEELAVMIRNECEEIIKKYMIKLENVDLRCCYAAATNMYFLEEFMKRLILDKDMTFENSIFAFARLKAYEYTKG